jgi:hypothetical protein
MYPAWRGAACDWASDARCIAAEAFFFFPRSSKGLKIHFEDCGSQEITRRIISQAEPICWSSK